MKILAIGDFHGKFPKKFEKIIKKQKIDAVISVGDYPPFHYREIWFKHCFGKENVELWEVIGKTKYKKLVIKDHNLGETVLKKLNKLPVPVFTVLGNIDYPFSNDIADFHLKNQSKWKWSREAYLLFPKIINKYKKIRRFDYTFAKFKDFVFIGMRGHTFQGKVKSKAFKKHRAILDNLFKKFEKENNAKKVIFVSHIPPLNTKLDKIGMKAHPKVRGTHRGSKLTRRIIERYQPILNLCGHTHEAWGKDKIRKTLCVNTGAANEGRAAIIKISEKGKLNVKFIN
ncbi:MAG: metallophosphoesterase [Nanoarchaeota archaeon]|nr:metallophosphoesterase [Nanoarchaeota archaeon]MBU1051502.1 metallophosphoesterase [Nanoarchaeota archaeon]MBU1988688.1 metallophosphoesterase [Nanoarchaeota archaeon]